MSYIVYNENTASPPRAVKCKISIVDRATPARRHFRCRAPRIILYSVGGPSVVVIAVAGGGGVVGGGGGKGAPPRWGVSRAPLFNCGLLAVGRRGNATTTHAKRGRVRPLAAGTPISSAHL